MKNSELKDLFLKETEKVDIQMSEKLKNTEIHSLKHEAVTETRKKKFDWAKFLFPVATFACLVVFILTFALPTNTTEDTPYLTAYVMEINSTTELESEEENPTIAFVTDDEDNIINICSVNEDADTILSNTEFGDLTGMKLNEAIEKVIKIVSNEGFFAHHEDKIKIYALNDDEKILDRKLDRFGEIVRDGLREFGHNELDFEKRPMKINDFKNMMGFEKFFEKLDDMKEDLRQHEMFKGHFPPPPNHDAGNPSGENPSPPSPDET